MAGKARRQPLTKRAKQRRQRKRMVPRRGGRGDSGALRGIKQGVGKSVVKAFGGTSVVSRYHPCHHDAFHHFHLPLPRATGPYTIVRTTQLLPFGNSLEILGPFWDRNASKWSDLCAIEVVDGTKTLGTANNITPHAFLMMRGNASWNGAQVTPAAFSVQVMNPQALQGTNGIVYIGRVRTSVKLSDIASTTGDVLANELVSYNNPRLCSAAKLAFRGVQTDGVPFNMSELANFTDLSAPSFTSYGSSTPNPMGFAPIFIYNPDKVKLQLLVCCEWRVRFDPSNPAQATHIHHAPASESVWAQAQHYAESLGNGVVDIADRVANIGQAVYGAAGSMYGAMRGVRALRGAAQLALM